MSSQSDLQPVERLFQIGLQRKNIRTIFDHAAEPKRAAPLLTVHGGALMRTSSSHC